MVSGVFSIALEACASPSPAAGPRGTARALAVRQYIGSDENRLVQSAAAALLSGDVRMSPLVLYGPSGTGKTLLALGLAQRWRDEQSSSSVVVTTGADFARSYAYAVDTDSVADFRTKSHSAALFVVDDLQQLEHKTAAQEEFTRLLDALAASGSLVLVTASRAPWSLPGLSARLASRLSGGLIVPLAAPGMAARRELITRLAGHLAMELSAEAIDLLVSGPPGADSRGLTVPALHQMLMELRRLVGSETPRIERQSVQQLWSELAQHRAPSLRTMVARVAKYFAISVSELRGPSRRSQIVRARGVAMLLARELTGRSLQAIGSYFGRRDHTTVLHACRKTELLRDTDPAIATALAELKEQLVENLSCSC